MNERQTSDARPRLLRLGSLIDEFAEDAARRHEAHGTGRLLGAVSGFKSLDRGLGGAMAPGLHILHGSPGSGKSAFALQLAGSCQCPCLFVTCEMTPLELMRRVTARVTKTYLGRFKTGELAPDHVVKLARQAVDSVPLLAIVDATTAPAQPKLLSEFAAATRRLAPDNPHFLLVVDSVHAWVRSIANEATEYERLNAGLDALRQLAQILSCPVLGLAERNRASMSGGGQSASAGSRSFEYASETILELNASDNDDGLGERSVELKLSKNRHGTQGKTIPLRFKGATQSFWED